MRSVTMFLICAAVGTVPCLGGSGAAWTWISGSDTPDQPGVYGTRGVATPTNVPGARGGSISWTDGSGRLWLFGGEDVDGYLNDLWEFDGQNWTWVSGADTVDQLGIYGTKRVAVSTNVPGARVASISWRDSSGNLWLFGGLGYAAGGEGYLNDLWKFDGTNWIWISGADTTNHCGVYGAKGVSASSNMPGARAYSVSWIDGSGNLWLFGGGGYAANGQDCLNDLWKFDGTSWTWVSGSDAISQPGVYGMKGVAAPTNVPGARLGAISWRDGSGNLWLFGGRGYAANGGWDYLNDLWKFDGTNWTWISGSDSPNQSGAYGTKGLAAAGNVPGARMCSISWTDSGGNLWLFGGEAVDGYYFSFNDLWKYDGTNWTWVSGSGLADQHGVYGTKGVTTSGSMPGTRDYPISWKDTNGNLWLFGGRGYAALGKDFLNDLWMFGIPDDAADVNGSGFVDTLDLMALVEGWLTTTAIGAQPADLAPQPAGDGVADFRDFAVFAARWMHSI